MSEECLWCGGEGCGVCDEQIAEQNRRKWRRNGTLKPCRTCGQEFDVLILTAGQCYACGLTPEATA